MKGPQSSPSPSRIPAARGILAICATGLACLSLLLAAPAALGAEEAVKYIHENTKEYERQLNAGEITSATVNRRARSIHLGLKNGQKALIKYGAKEEEKYAAQLQAKGVQVVVLKKSAALAEQKKEAKTHHKLRYIIGGILIAVVVIVAAVLIFNRRRRLAAE